MLGRVVAGDSDLIPLEGGVELEASDAEEGGDPPRGALSALSVRTTPSNQRPYLSTPQLPARPVLQQDTARLGPRRPPPQEQRSELAHDLAQARPRVRPVTARTFSVKAWSAFALTYRGSAASG